MTDEEAREYIHEIDSRKIPDKMVRLMRHCLLALADRQALVRAVAHATLLDTTLAETFDAARRHMEGQ